ncbi:FAD-dependent oxidoreductase [Paraburkholderia sediminicola]|uniref:FAD-dependent oxidoreductase n=1 Tax=Paraburkholderia metrosideri TaxID=580937 RepID=A0ABW9DSX6_9BURK
MTQNRVLIVGGGIGGMSTAIALAELGWAVDLIDLDPQWRVYGAGITITGPTLRAFKALGVLPDILELAYTGTGIQVCAVDGTRLTVLATPVREADGIPGCGGIMRPVLHRILSGRTRSAGVNIALGLSVEALQQDADGVDVTFTDGTLARYCLVVGADGLFSKVRKIILPHAPEPEFTGQNAWRLLLDRPEQIDRRHFFLGGPFKVGLTPVSDREMYMFLLQNTSSKLRVPEAELHTELRKLTDRYEGPVKQIGRQLTAQSPIVLRPLEAFLLPGPWYKGRVVLVGDAAHPTTPQLASGAGLAVEDALVLRDELAVGTSVPKALHQFMARRYARCRLVVENSLEIGRREQAGRPMEDQTILVEESLRILADPI